VFARAAAEAVLAAQPKARCQISRQRPDHTDCKNARSNANAHRNSDNA
jgi:hypothetical protein